MTDLFTSGSLYWIGERKVREANGDSRAVIEVVTWRETFSRLLHPFRRYPPGRGLCDMSGRPLFRFESKTGDFRTWMKVLDLDGTVIARVDRIGSKLTRFKHRFTIQDASGTEIGRIDNPRLGYEFVIYTAGDRCVASAHIVRQSYWETRYEGGTDFPWPQITAAFFLSVGFLMATPGVP